MNKTKAPLLKAVNLRTYIPARRGIVHAVDGVSFDLHMGETLAIVGESGCGKSVLCRTIMGLLPEKAVIGEGSSLQLNAKQLVGLKESQYNQLRATQMAMVFQDPLSSLHPVMTVGRQIGESMACHLKMPPGQVAKRVVSLIAAVGLPHPEKFTGLYPHQLSGGMRQRIAIAIALACDPKLLIADEPTTALDTTVQAGILALLNHLQVKRKMSILMVTHDLAVASNVADQIAVMYAGKLMEIAPPSKLFKQPNHPYTKALIDSIPKISQPSHAPLTSIGGRIPDSAEPAPGCRFLSRCPQEKDRCHRKEPSLDTGPSADHLCACWYPLGGILP